MDELKKYDKYCLLVSRLDAKSEQLKKATNEMNQLQYDVGSLKKDIQDIEKELNLTPSATARLNMMRMNQCFDMVVDYEGGGGIDDSPVQDFKQSDEYKNLTKGQKDSFKKLEPILLVNQYNLQNAILIVQDMDEDVDVTELIAIRDYVDNTAEKVDGYEDMSMDKLKEIKEIMYIFVEHVSKI